MAFVSEPVANQQYEVNAILPVIVMASLAKGKSHEEATASATKAA